MRCLNCDTEFVPKTSRAKFDTDKCRVEYFRNNKVSTVTNDSVTQRDVTESPVTVTDALFESEYPGYYKFSDKVFSRGCILSNCGNKFTTRLQLLKFCSPEHMTQGLDNIVKQGKP